MNLPGRVAVVLLTLALMAGSATAVWAEAPCGVWRAVPTAGKIPDRCEVPGRIGRRVAQELPETAGFLRRETGHFRQVTPE